MRTLRAILALYVLVWFNVVVPAHTRGIVDFSPQETRPLRVPNDVSSLTSSTTRQIVAPASCCGATSAVGGQSTSDQENRDLPPKSKPRTKICGICTVAAWYIPPAPLFIYQGLTGITSELEFWLGVYVFDARPMRLPTWPHAPPFAAFA